MLRVFILKYALYTKLMSLNNFYLKNYITDNNSFRIQIRCNNKIVPSYLSEKNNIIEEIFI